LPSERSNPLRNLLIRLVWDPRARPDDFVIVFASRGAPEGVESVRGSSIERVYLRGFEVREGAGRRYIPFHRVVLVKNVSTGEVVYERGRRP